METVVLHAPIEFERVASKHARLAGTTVALITLRCSTRLARGQQEGARCGCFRFGWSPASVAQHMGAVSRIDDACPPRSPYVRAYNWRGVAWHIEWLLLARECTHVARSMCVWCYIAVGMVERE